MLFSQPLVLGIGIFTAFDGPFGASGMICFIMLNILAVNKLSKVSLKAFALRFGSLYCF